MRIGVPRETTARERRVALTPAGAAKLVKAGHRVAVEPDAGAAAGFTDANYRSAGAAVEPRMTVIGTDGAVLQVTGPTVEDLDRPEWSGLGKDHLVIALHDPLWRPDRTAQLAVTGATAIALELIPRTTKAQSMDVLSSMATVAGYNAALLAAFEINKLAPMMMTAAGTVPPARIIVLGAGVAGLQAIATARRLGAVVEGYDIRAAAREQIRSLGARAIELGLDAGPSEDESGYARAQTEHVNRRQAELLTPYVAAADAVITTAAVPGATSPELVTVEMVEAMAPGSVIVDLAADRGGNCRLTEPNREVVHDGVLILGPTDLASQAPATASLMFSNNIVSLLDHLMVDGEPSVDLDDEITSAIVVAHNGEVRHPRVRAALGLEPSHEGAGGARS